MKSLNDNIMRVIDDLDETKLAIERQGFNLSETPTSEYSIAIDEISKTFKEHIDSRDNPHGVTKEQVGLGNVENVAALPLTGGTLDLKEELRINSSNTSSAALAIYASAETENFIRLGFSNGAPALRIGGGDATFEIQGVSNRIRMSLDADGNAIFPSSVTAPVFKGRVTYNVATFKGTSNQGGGYTKLAEAVIMGVHSPWSLTFLISEVENTNGWAGIYNWSGRNSGTAGQVQFHSIRTFGATLSPLPLIGYVRSINGTTIVYELWLHSTIAYQSFILTELQNVGIAGHGAPRIAWASNNIGTGWQATEPTYVSKVTPV